MKGKIISKFFKFENKIGYSEIIALLAIIIATISLFHNNSSTNPMIDVTEVSTEDVGGPFLNKQLNQWNFFSYHRLRITNQGGKPVTLIGVTPYQEPPASGRAVFGIIEKTAISVPFKIALTKKLLTEIEETSHLIEDLDYMNSESLSLLNRLIKPGGNIFLNIAILIDPYNESVPICDYAFTDLNLNFSDGTKYRFKRAAEILPIK